MRNITIGIKCIDGKMEARVVVEKNASLKDLALVYLQLDVIKENLKQKFKNSVETGEVKNE